MKRLFTIASFAALMLVSCDKPSNELGAEGEGSVAITCGTSTEVTAITRAELTTEVSCTTPAIEDFSLTIDGVSMNYTADYAAVAEFNDSYLYKGTYKATVASGDVTVEGYDKAAFVGEAEFEVKAREHTNVEITATIANSLVKVEVTDQFKSYFPGGYSLTLTTAQGNDFDVTAQSELLFVAPTSFVVNGSATKQPNQSGAEGVTVALPELKCESLQPRTIYNVTFDVSTAGQATLTITLNESLVESVEIDEELNQYA